MTVRFMLLMPWGRVGSNLLMSILRQSENIKLASEYLNRLRTPDEQIAWLKDFYEFSAADPSKPHIGSKQNRRAIVDLEGVKHIMAQHSVRIVRLRRDNVVKSAISQMRGVAYSERAKQNGGEARWYMKGAEEPLGPIRVDPDLLLKRIGFMDTAQRDLMAAFPPDAVLDIEYEEINANLANVIERLRGYLDLPQTPYQVDHTKLTPDDLSAAVSNPDEVRSALAGTPYSGFI